MRGMFLSKGGTLCRFYNSPMLASWCLLTLRSCGIPALGMHARSKTTFDGRTTDPYSHYKRRIRALKLQRHEKIELVSRERRVREIELPVHVSSISK